MTIKKIVGWDTETFLIRPGRLAPELVCLSYQVYDVETGLKSEPKLVNRFDAPGLLWMWLTEPETLLVGHNVSYDVAVMCADTPSLLPLFVRAYEADRITDTQIREQLIMLAAGRFKGHFDTETMTFSRTRYDLEGLAARHLGKTLDKDTWRLRYAEFVDPSLRGRDLQEHAPEYVGKEMPLESWPESAREYPRQDAVATLGVYLKQRDNEEYIEDQYRQTRYALWKHLCSVRGLKTDPASVLKFKQATEEDLEEVQERLVAAGLVRKNGSRDTKAAAARMIQVCSDQGLQLRLTEGGSEKVAEARAKGLDQNQILAMLREKGGVQLDADACEAVDDEVLEDYANFTTLGAMLNKDVPMLMAGVTQPIHTRFGMAESGRTTSSSNKVLGAGTGNLQNIRRAAKKKKGESKEAYEARLARSGDIRQCFIPRKGYVFLQADYEQLELRTLAQVCLKLFGRSKLAEALNAGLDPHSIVAALILKKPYEWVLENKKLYEVENARQTAKVANFGFPGGLGAKTLVKFARKSYGVIITEEEARNLKQIWLEAYPEMALFFEHVADNGGFVKQLYSNRLRGGCSFCAACNTYFQGLGADASQNAGWLIMKACYIDESSPLYGARIVNYVHDEYILECPLTNDIDAAAKELESLMIRGAKEFLPDLNVSAPPLAMTCWSKSAKAKYDDAGRLIPWSPGA